MFSCLYRVKVHKSMYIIHVSCLFWHLILHSFKKVNITEKTSMNWAQKCLIKSIKRSNKDLPGKRRFLKTLAKCTLEYRCANIQRNIYQNCKYFQTTHTRTSSHSTFQSIESNLNRCEIPERRISPFFSSTPVVYGHWRMPSSAYI